MCGKDVVAFDWEAIIYGADFCLVPATSKDTVTFTLPSCASPETVVLRGAAMGGDLVMREVRRLNPGESVTVSRFGTLLLH